VQEEIDRVLGDKDTPTFDEISDLRYLELCLKESMRLYPPVAMFIRQTNKTLQITPEVSLPPYVRPNNSNHSPHLPPP